MQTINRTVLTDRNRSGYERLADAVLAQGLHDVTIHPRACSNQEGFYRADAIRWIRDMGIGFKRSCCYCKQDPSHILEAAKKHGRLSKEDLREGE